MGEASHVSPELDVERLVEAVQRPQTLHGLLRGLRAGQRRQGIQRDDQVWASEHIRYNFLTHEIEAQQFRTGKSPVFAMGEGLGADPTNNVYAATNAIVTADATRCGKCHPTSPTHKYNATVPLNANGYAACGGGNFTINQTVTRTTVTCDNVLCHTGKTTPNWW